MSNFIISAFGDEIDMSLDVQMEVLASHDIRFIELRGVDGKNVAVLTPEEAREIKRRLENNGFGVSCIGSPIGKIEIHDDFDKHLEVLKNLLEVTSILESRYIRMFSFYYPKEDGAELYKEEVISRIGIMTELAKKSGMILLHENEKDIYGDIPERCLDILKEVDSPNIKAIFDPANFIQSSVTPYPYAFDLLKEYIVYVHIKDALMETGQVVPSGCGDGNIRAMLAELKTDGFGGYLSIEPHLGMFDGLEKLQKDIDVMRIKKGGRDSFAVASDALKKILDNI
ncbi:MAG: sugar phosphate isomerase/epimerase family protein [Saccharofermentanales bacterium]